MNPQGFRFLRGDREARLCLLGTFLFTALLLYLTHIPNTRVPAWIARFGDDKFKHAVAYGVWACLALGATRGWIVQRGRAVVGVLLAAALVSALDEQTQPWFGRTCSFWDFSASVLGAVMGCSLMLVWEMRRPAVLEPEPTPPAPRARREVPTPRTVLGTETPELPTR